MVNCVTTVRRRPPKVKTLVESSERSSTRGFKCSAPSANRLGFQRHCELGLGCNDTDAPSLPGAGLASNHDLDILVECGQQVH